MVAISLPDEYESIDPVDPALFASGRGHPYWSWLREHDPVHWDPVNELWVIAKHEDVALIERTPQPYSSAHGIRPRGAASGDMSIIALDDPEHARQRKLISAAFTPSRIRSMMDHIREVARELVNEIAGLGACDFVEKVAYPLPVIVIAEMLGLPIEDRERLARWSDSMMGGDCEPPDSAAVAQASQAWAEYVAYVNELLEDRKAHPRDDLISAILAAHDAGELRGAGPEGIGAAVEEGLSSADAHMHDHELLSFLVLLLVAGNETTRNGMSGGMAVLSEHPDQLARLAADPSLVPSATEEILRWASPVLNFSRTLTADTELRGVSLRAGDQVLLVYPSANRDEDTFERPFEFDIERSPNLHLAFGAGPHFCLGANLARTEIRIMLEELLARLPDIRVADGEGPDRGESSLVATIRSLPVVYSPA